MSEGHNGINGETAQRLRSIVERVETLHTQRADLAADISDIFKEAKSAGFDTAAIRALIRIRAKDPAEVEEQEALVDLYRRAMDAG